MNKKKVIIGVLMAAIFVMSAFIPVGGTIQNSNNTNTNFVDYKSSNYYYNNSILIKFHGIKNLFVSLFSHKELNKVLIYKNIQIIEKSKRVNLNEVLASFNVHTLNFNKKVNVTIYQKDNKYIIYNTNSENSLEINNKAIIYDPGGTYYYYVTSSGKGSHTWHSSISTGTWTMCSRAIVNTDTFFITWNGPVVVLLFGFIPALYLPTSSWHASNPDGWSLGCGSFYSRELMPVSGDKTVNDYHGSDTTVKISACWEYGVGGA